MLRSRMGGGWEEGGWGLEGGVGLVQPLVVFKSACEPAPEQEQTPACVGGCLSESRADCAAPGPVFKLGPEGALRGVQSR